MTSLTELDGAVRAMVTEREGKKRRMSVATALQEAAEAQKCSASVIQEAVSYILGHGLHACAAAVAQDELEQRCTQVSDEGGTGIDPRRTGEIGSLPNRHLKECADSHRNTQPKMIDDVLIHGAANLQSRQSQGEESSTECSASVGDAAAVDEASSAEEARLQSHLDLLMADLDSDSDLDADADSGSDPGPVSDPISSPDLGPVRALELEQEAAVDERQTQTQLQSQQGSHGLAQVQEEQAVQEQEQAAAADEGHTQLQSQQQLHDLAQATGEEARILREYTEVFRKRPHCKYIANVGWQKDQLAAYKTNIELVGSRVEVFWPRERQWFPGNVTGYEPDLGHSRTRRIAGGLHAVDYDDGESLLHDMTPGATKYRILSPRGAASGASQDAKRGKGKGAVDDVTVTPPSCALTVGQYTGPGEGTVVGTGSRQNTRYANSSATAKKQPQSKTSNKSNTQTAMECPHCIRGCGKLLGHEGRHRKKLLAQTARSDPKTSAATGGQSSRGAVRCVPTESRPPPAIPPTKQGLVGPQLLKQPVRKFFERLGTFDGIVYSVTEKELEYEYTVQYSDGEQEHMRYGELKPLLLKSWRERRRLWGYPTDLDESSEEAVQAGGSGATAADSERPIQDQQLISSAAEKDGQDTRTRQRSCRGEDANTALTQRQQSSSSQPKLRKGHVRCLDGIDYEVEEICGSRRAKGGQVRDAASSIERSPAVWLSPAHACVVAPSSY